MGPWNFPQEDWRGVKPWYSEEWLTQRLHPWLGNSSQGSGHSRKNSKTAPSCDLSGVDHGAHVNPQYTWSQRHKVKCSSQLWGLPWEYRCGGESWESAVLVHTEVEKFWPREFMKERDRGLVAQAFLLWPSENVQEAIREQKPQRQSAHLEPIPLTRGGATSPRQRHLRSKTAGSSPRRQTRRIGEWQGYRSHRMGKLQSHRRIVYWAPDFPTRLI